MKKLFLLLSWSCLTFAGNIDIVKDGKACAVVVQGESSKSCILAVDTLLHCVEKSTGVKLTVIEAVEVASTDPAFNRIIIGDCDFAKANGLESRDLQLEEYRILARGRDIFLIGHDKEEPQARVTGAPGKRHPAMDSRQYSPATAWAVTTLLERQAGVRFLWPGELGTYCPKRKDLALQDGFSLQERPFYQRRQMWFGAGTWEDGFDATNKYMMLQQQGNRINTWFIDAFQGWWEAYANTDPELIALSPEGKRTYHVKPTHVKICISNPRVIPVILERWRAAGKPEIWSMCPNDGAGFCTCPECRKWDSEEAQKATAEEIWLCKVSLTKRYVTFWNKVLTELRKENANVQICVFGYGPYKLFPTDCKLEPGVLSAVVPGDFDIHGKGMKEWNSWANSGAKLFVRPNWLNTFWFSPYFPLRKTAEFMRAIEDRSIGYEQDTFGGCWATQGLYCYMLLRMSYRRELTVDDIKQEYISAFGAGAPAILKWIEYWEDYTDRLRGGIAEEADSQSGGLYDQICAKNKYIRPHILYGCWDALPEVYPQEIMAPAYALLDEAEKAIADSDVEAKARVEFLRNGMQHVDKMSETLTLYWKNPLGRSDEFMQSFNELFRMRKTLERSFVVQIHQLMYNEFSRRIRIVPRNPDNTIPNEEVYIKEWMHKQ